MNPLKIPNPSPSLSSAAIKARYRCLQSHWQPPSPYHPHQAVNMPIGGCWCIASVDHPSCHWQGTKTPMTRVENLATNSSGESEYRAGMSNKVLHVSLCQNPLSAWLSKTLGIVLGWPRHFVGLLHALAFRISICFAWIKLSTMIVLFLHSLLPQKDRKQDGIPEPGQCDTNLTRDEESRDWVYRTSFWVGTPSFFLPSTPFWAAWSVS